MRAVVLMAAMGAGCMWPCGGETLKAIAPGSARARVSTLDRWLSSVREPPAGVHGSEESRSVQAVGCREHEGHKELLDAALPTHKRPSSPAACSLEIQNLLFKYAQEGNHAVVQRILQTQALDVNTPLLLQGMSRAVTLLDVAEDREHAPLATLLLSMGAKTTKAILDEERDRHGDKADRMQEDEDSALFGAWAYDHSGYCGNFDSAREETCWVERPAGEDGRLTKEGEEAIRGFGGKSLFDGELALKGSLSLRDV